MGKAVGLSAADIETAQTGQSNDAFSHALMRAVDELDEKTTLSDQTWLTLGERLDERQRMDLIFTVGNYIALAMAVNTFGVEVEADHDGGTQER
jgi:hypothetical protein